jgi:DNA-binding NtrC family response regulator
MPFSGFVTRDYRLLSVCNTVAALANSCVILLIEGQRGTGKSLLARKLHETSFRCLGSFVELDCSTPEGCRLAKGLLDGLRPNPYAAREGASAAPPLSGGGTLLLDKVVRAPESLWEATARVAQLHRDCSPQDEGLASGGWVRLVLATTEPLRQEQLRLLEGGAGEETRLVRVRLPDLAERVGDVPLLAEYFLRGFSRQCGARLRRFDRSALAMLVRYPWPGNVAELKASVEHAVLAARDARIAPQDLPGQIQAYTQADPGSELPAPLGPLKAALREPERRYILKTLRKTRWNKQLAARKLRISRSTLYKKFREHNLNSAANVAEGAAAQPPRWVTVVDSETARGIH